MDEWVKEDIYIFFIFGNDYLVDISKFMKSALDIKFIELGFLFFAVTGVNLLDEKWDS